MSLTYHFRLTAPASVGADQLTKLITNGSVDTMAQRSLALQPINPALAAAGYLAAELDKQLATAVGGSRTT